MDKYSEFFHEVSLFYRKNFEILKRNQQIDESINTATLSRVFVSMIDGIILHKGFFNIPDDQHIIMVEDSIRMFKLGLNNNK